MRTLVTLHRWAGIVLSVPLLAIALSGTLLLFRDSLWVPSQWRDVAWDVPAADRTLVGALVAAPSWLYVDMARPGRAFHTVGVAGGPVEVLPITGERLQSPPPRLAIELRLFDLHTRLWLGDPGKGAVRIVGPAAFLSAIVGLVLWWPRRRSWRAADLARGAGTRAALLKLHMAWGGALVMVLLPLVLSGTLMAHNPAIRGWLRSLSPPPAPLPAEVAALVPVEAGLDAALSRARSSWPEGELTQISRPTTAATQVSFKFRLPGERHPNGRSTITFDLATGRMTAMRDARRGGWPAAYDDVLYAFHTADLGGAAQAWAWFAGGAALLLLAVTGVWSWLRRPLRGR